MKRTLSIAGQFLLFFLVDAVGSIFYHPFGIITSTHTPSAASRSFQWDGLLLMTIFFLLILIVEAMRKRLRVAAPWSLLSLLLAALAGYFLKFGFITHKW